MKPELSWKPEINDHKGPIYLALADQLASDIASGRLIEGTRLPPQRTLAWELGITHGTVTRAYEQAEKRKLVQAVVGRGTFVAAASEPPSPLLPPSGDAPEMDMARNFSFPHLEPDLSEALSTIAQQSGINALLSYAPAEGLLRHREAGRQMFQLFNITCDVEQILVTSGAQHALQVILQSLFKDGDCIAVDDLTYPNFISAAPRLGIKLIPIKTDEDGMCPDHLEAACKKHPIRGLFLIPNVQNPTGRSISPTRLETLAQIAQARTLTVIEDDPYSALLTGPKNSFYNLIPERTCSIATASKVIGGGLRTGFLAAPESFHAPLRRAIGDTNWMASPILAEIVRHWISTGKVETTLKRKRAVLAQRHQLVRKTFGKSVEIYPDRLSCWLTLPENVNPAVFELEAARRGVSILGGHHFVVGRTPVPNAIRITLGAIASHEIFSDAISRLDALIKDS